jgi:hypothetical protein
MVHDRGVIRIRTKNDKSFGRLRMDDPIYAEYRADEIIIHTPAEHFL